MSAGLFLICLLVLTSSLLSWPIYHRQVKYSDSVTAAAFTRSAVHAFQLSTTLELT